MNIFYISRKNLIYRPWGTMLGVLLIALGLGLATFILLVNKQLNDQFERNLAGVDLILGAKGSPLQMVLCNLYHVDYPTGNIEIDEIKAFLNPNHPLVEMAVPLSIGDSYKGFRIVGTEEPFLQLYPAELQSGNWWGKHFEVTAGAFAARQLGLDVGYQFHSSHGLMTDEHVHDYTEPFVVVGIMEETGTVADQLLLTSTQSVWLVHNHEHDHEDGHEHNDDEQGHDHDENHDHAHEHEGDHDHNHDDNHDHTHNDHDHNHDNIQDDHGHHDHGQKHETVVWSEQLDQEITSLLIKFRSRTNFSALNLLRSINENTGIMAASPAIELNRMHLFIGNAERLFQVLAYIILGVSALSIFIALYSSLGERKYEISLMRVMGGSRFRVASLLLGEGILLALIGGILGLLLAHLGMEMFAGFMTETYRYPFTGWIWYPEEWYILGAALVIGIAAAILPAIQVYRTDINKTLMNR